MSAPAGRLVVSPKTKGLALIRRFATKHGYTPTIDGDRERWVLDPAPRAKVIPFPAPSMFHRKQAE